MSFHYLTLLPRTTGIFLLLLVSTVFAASAQESSSIGNVVVPQPAKPSNALACVEPTEIMRRDHMKFLLHQRDQTVISGIRSSKYSLTGCIDCHAQAATAGKIVRADNPDFFCTSCHQYTGVKIDCFECHADRPVASFSQNSLESDETAALARIDFAKTSSIDSVAVRSRLLQQVTLRDD